MDIKIEKKKSLPLKYIVALVLLVGAMLFVWKFSFAESLAAFRIEKDQVMVERVEDGSFADYINITGSVEPIATIYLDAYLGGRVEEKLVEEGTMVKRGEVILKLENRSIHEQILESEMNLALRQNELRTTKINFDASKIQAQKELVEEKYNLLKSKRTFEQNSSLFSENLISKDTYLDATEMYELTKERLAILKQQTTQDSILRITTMKDLESDLGRMKKAQSMIYDRLNELNVKATADGQLSSLDVEIGQNINQGERIGQINILTNYKIEATIDEHYLDRIKQNLTATFDRNGKQYELRLKKVDPEVQNGRFKVDFVFTSDKPENIKSGQTYHINLKLGEPQNAIMIPRGSFYQHTAGQWIFVLDPSEKFATKRDIKIGKQNTKYYEVLSGLDEGEKVITSNYKVFGEAEKIVFYNE